MQPLHPGIISIPGSPKTWTWKLSIILAPMITQKSQKGVQSGSQETPKITLTSMKMNTWTSRCLLGVPILRVPQDGLKVSKVTVLPMKSNPVQQSTSQQFPPSKRAGSRSEALKSAALVRPLRCTAHGVSGYTVRVSLLYGSVYASAFTSPFRKANVTLVTFARACRNAVLLDCGFPHTKTTPGRLKCCFT